MTQSEILRSIVRQEIDRAVTKLRSELKEEMGNLAAQVLFAATKQAENQSIKRTR